MILFDPQPDPAERPARLPSPFDPAPPHAWARRAVAEAAWPEVDEGKMFGVLVAEDARGQIGYLRAFSGMLGGSWFVDGFAPPIFDAAKMAFWPAAEAHLDELERRIGALRPDAAMSARHAAELAELRRRRADKAEVRRLHARHAAERGPDAPARDAARRALEAERAEKSRSYMTRIFDAYVIASARGERRPLRELFAPLIPPGGAGDCAAPKLLAAAYAAGLRPLALAEFWRGPSAGGRHAGQFYPACRGKCGPILPFMMQGLPVDDAPIFGAAAPPELPILHEDEHLVVVDKPCGLLSVPGRHDTLRDSVQTRLGASAVHRLDLDTSGLLLAARDAATLATLQRQFALREVDKRYVAVLDGPVAAAAGTIDLPIRVDLDDRPRQIHDPVHGKKAITEFRVLARDGATTRIAFLPRTGRSHQLRVHAALALAAPIVGDRLYGRAPADARLMLHAESLTFTHPATGEAMTFTSPAPF